MPTPGPRSGSDDPVPSPVQAAGHWFPCRGGWLGQVTQSSSSQHARRAGGRVTSERPQHPPRSPTPVTIHRAGPSGKADIVLETDDPPVRVGAGSVGNS